MSFAHAYKGKVKNETNVVNTAPGKLSPRINTDIFNSTQNSALYLQRTLGNQAVQTLTRSSKIGSDFGRIRIYPKLKVSQPDDPHEQEADRVADEVMRMSITRVAPTVTGTEEMIGRKCGACETKEEGNEKLHINRKSLPANGLEPSEEAMNEINAIRSSSGHSLDAGTKTFMETRLGYDLGNVRIHTGEAAARSAQSVGALAYTVADNVVFGHGQYQPNSTEGKRLLAHELVHVIQQGSAVTTKQAPIGISSNHPQLLSRASLGEMWDAITGVGPYDAYVASKLADDALAAAVATRLPGLHNGPADAWRHAYWNCIMTKRLGASQAKTIADNHEAHGGGPAIENAMDLFNNAAGRICGSGSGGCDSCTWSKLNSGDLRIIDPTTMTLTPSRPVGSSSTAAPVSYPPY